MTITSVRRICDVTGKEVPTLKLEVGEFHTYDLSHEGAIELLGKITSPPLDNGAGTAVVVEIGRIKAYRPPEATAEQLAFVVPDGRAKAAFEKVRKQAARECLEIVCSISQREEPTPVTSAFRSFVRERITKAFGL